MNAGMLIVLLVALTGLAAEPAYTQQTSDANETSLGDIARKLKTEKPKNSKPVRVITNDDIERLRDGTQKSAATSRNEPKEKEWAESGVETPGAPAEVHDETYYRTKMSKLQGKLDTDKRELEVLQQKLSLNDMQYYADPNKALQQQYSREDINKLTADIAAKKEQVADDGKAIEDLHDQLRHDNGDPAWLR